MLLVAFEGKKWPSGNVKRLGAQRRTASAAWFPSSGGGRRLRLRPERLCQQRKTSKAVEKQDETSENATKPQKMSLKKAPLCPPLALNSWAHFLV